MPQSLARPQPPQHLPGLRNLAPAVVQHFRRRSIEMQQSRPDMEQQVAQLRAELRKARDERDRAHRVLEVTEWKALASANDRTTIEMLEAELEASRESEKRMLDSLTMQTKQLELTKIALEEARLEVATLQESVRALEARAPAAPPSTPRGRHERDRDLQRVHGELRVALAAEEKSKKAMEELVMALKEVNAELHGTRQQLARARHEAETARMEADRTHVSAKRKDDKLRALADEAARLRADAEDSSAAWRAKEAGFTACIRAAEAELAEARRENARLLDSQRSGRAEVAKLRDILKQAVKDAKVVKEALEEARSENALLKGLVGDKDTAVKCSRQELENLRVSEAAARDSVRELQSILEATSSSPTAAMAAAAKLDVAESPSPRPARVAAPVLDKYPSDSKIRPPAGLTRPRRMSETETFEGSVYDIFSSAEDQKGEGAGAFSSMPRLPGRRRVVMRKVGSLFRWKSFNNK